MARYNTLLAERRSLPYFSEERSYYLTGGRSAQWAPELSSSRTTSHYIPTPASFVSPWNAVHFSCQPEYNTRSAPTQYPAAAAPPSSPPSLLDAISVYIPPYTRPASRATASDAYSTPYDADPSSASVESSASPPPIKEEQPDDDGFIVDLLSASHSQSFAPPTEVPLRATQASPRMRRMMGVFRLNPFTMHAHGGRGVLAPWAGGEARPLDEEPRIFEFQVELAVEEEEADAKQEQEVGFDESGLRAFSPEFELDQEPREEDPEANWELAYPALSAFDPVTAYPRALHAYNASSSCSPATARTAADAPAQLDAHYPLAPHRWQQSHEPAFPM